MNPLTMNPCVTIMAPMPAPIERAPIFPQKILDGYLSDQKYPARAPARQTMKRASEMFPKKNAFKIKVRRRINDRPGASPLNPECMFTRFDTTGTYVVIMICG